MNNSAFEPIVCIVRHGETLWNKEHRLQGQINNIAISESGIMQMEHIAFHLGKMDLKWVAILSPMLRVQNSFNVINHNLSISEDNVFIVDNMKEMNFGDFEGKKKESIKNHSFFEERKIDKWNTPYPNGESYEDLYKRVVTSDFLKIVETAQKSFFNILIVGHSSLNKVLPIILRQDKNNKDEAINIQQSNDEVIILEGDFFRKVSFLQL